MYAEPKCSGSHLRWPYWSSLVNCRQFQMKNCWSTCLMWSASFCHFPRTECSNICFTLACSQAVRSVWEFKIGFEAFHSLKKMRNSIYQYLQKPNSDSPVKNANKDAFFGTIDVADMKLLPISSQCLHAWGGPSQVLNQMLDKDIICHILPTSIVLLLCPHCTAEPIVWVLHTCFL